MACNCGQRRLYNGYQYGNGSTCNNCGNNASYVNATNYWDSTGFDWLAAMQAAAANQCEEATPVCSRTGRDNYFLEIVSLLMALMHHHYHE